MTQTVLLLDAGNSALKWAWADRQGLHEVHAVAYDVSGAQILLPPFSLPHADSAFGCLVASELIRAALEEKISTAVTWLGAQAQFDDGKIHLSNGYAQPLQLGADRWHALLGARALYPDTACVLMQAGTATTLDGISAAGDFVGGEILPGLTLMQASLAQSTARLPQAQGRARAFADNTLDAIASGVLDAQLGALQRYWRRFVTRHAPEGNAPLILTGGAAAVLAAAWAQEGTQEKTQDALQDRPAVHVQHNLVLQGLWRRWLRGESE